MDVAVLGGGSWGTALAVHLAKKGHQIRIWEFVEEQAKEMQEERLCRLLPSTPLPENIFVSSKMEKVLPGTELVLLVVPSDYAEATLKSAAEMLMGKKLVICSKGFAEGLTLLNEIATKYSENIYCMYGPTHAEEVCKGMFSGLVLAGGEGKEELQKEIESENLKVHLSDDIVGVQIAAALKNILAVFIGVLDGMQLGDNAKAYVMTEGLEEIRQIGLKTGAKENTFHGLAGMGDVIVTCGSIHSRNRYVGEQIGKGKKLNEVLTEMKMVAEGVSTAKLVPQLEEKYLIKIPLLRGVYDILFNNKNPQEVLSGL
jgi:glycerol-3-phosphate dehydrogenase (NAD(P)+)